MKTSTYRMRAVAVQSLHEHSSYLLLEILIRILGKQVQEHLVEERSVAVEIAQLISHAIQSIVTTFSIQARQEGLVDLHSR